MLLTSLMANSVSAENSNPGQIFNQYVEAYDGEVKY